MKRRLLYAMMALLLVGALVAATVQAGALTAGSYTYLLQGREINLPVDILSIKDAVVVPVDLLTALGVSVTAVADTIVLRRGPVKAQLKTGNVMASIGGVDRVLEAAPIRVSGRHFVPAGILPHLGYSLEVDGNFVILSDYATVQEYLSLPVQEANYDRVLAGLSMRTTVYGSNGAYGEATFTVLTPELLRDQRLPLEWGTRVRLLSMASTRTLLMVTLKNTSWRAVSLDPAQLYLVGGQGRQFNYQGTEVAVDGQVTAAVAPGATRISVLSYERASVPLAVYYEPNGTTLGWIVGP